MKQRYRPERPRDMDNCIFDVLNCIKAAQTKGGCIQMDIQFGCELNFVYMKRLLAHLLYNELVITSDRIPSFAGDTDQEQDQRRFFLTPAGEELYERMLVKAKAMNYKVRHNENKAKKSGFWTRTKKQQTR